METYTKTKKFRQKKQKLKLFRSSEPLKSILMWGINYSFSQLCHVTPRSLLIVDDYKAFLKIKVNNHGFNKDCMPTKFKFKEYCPLVFQSLREKFNVTPKDYLDSFTSSEPFWDTAVGRSGSKFMVTQNRHYVAKTVCSEEVEEMHHLLRKYYIHVVTTQGQSLLPQYLGMYRITYNDQETYFLVMRNVFSPRLTISSKYDLKGSSVEREANEKERIKPNPTLKDNDFVNSVGKLFIGEEERTRILNTLKQDIQFLESNNLIDYSIIVGIHQMKNLSEEDSYEESSAATIHNTSSNTQPHQPYKRPSNSGSPLHRTELNTIGDKEINNNSQSRQSESALNMSDIKSALNLNNSLTINFPSVNPKSHSSERSFAEESRSISKKIDDNISYEGKELPSAGDGKGSVVPDLNYIPKFNGSIINQNHPNYANRGQAQKASLNMEIDEDAEGSDDGVPVPLNKSLDYNPLSSSGGSPENSAFNYANFNPDESNLSNLTPPDSPRLRYQYNGKLLSDFEFYGISSKQDKNCVYFVGLIDILTRYGMRKKTFQTVKIGHEQSTRTLGPDAYGKRLYEFISTRIE